MRNLDRRGQESILFITHKLNEIMAVSDRCTVLRKGKYIGTVDIKGHHDKQELSKMMVGRARAVCTFDKKPGDSRAKSVLDVEGSASYRSKVA